MADAPRFVVREIELFERPVVLRLPFRFGVVTLTECPQAFARARIEFADGRRIWRCPTRTTSTSCATC
jgi:hypothetical protein